MSLATETPTTTAQPDLENLDWGTGPSPPQRDAYSTVDDFPLCALCGDAFQANAGYFDQLAITELPYRRYHRRCVLAEVARVSPDFDAWKLDDYCVGDVWMEDDFMVTTKWLAMTSYVENGGSALGWWADWRGGVWKQAWELEEEELVRQELEESAELESTEQWGAEQWGAEQAVEKGEEAQVEVTEVEVGGSTGDESEAS